MSDLMRRAGTSNEKVDQLERRIDSLDQSWNGPVPTKTSELTNDSGFITEQQAEDVVSGNETLAKAETAVQRDELAEVATTGEYADLLGRPELFSGSYDDLAGKPALFSGSYEDLRDAPSLFSERYEDLTGKPALFSGRYDDLSGVPDLFSGKYADLAGLPSLFSGNYADLAGKPSLAKVATSGSYADLTDKPLIPAAQVQSDWLAAAGPSAILNKPATFPPASHAHPISDITGLQVALNAKLTIPTGTASQYVRGDGSLGSLPTIPAAQVNSDWNATSGLAQILNKPVVKRIETYDRITDASGLVTVTYATPFASVPAVQPEPPLLPTQVWVKVSSTTTGFSLRLTQRAAATLLGLEILLAATTNVAGASAKIVVIEA